MSTTTSSGARGPLASRAAGWPTARRALLACGVLSSLLYVAADVAGGMRYPGYRFAAQAIADLVAAGAPSAAVAGPLFLAYDVLLLAFGIGVVIEAARRGVLLRVTGALLAASAVAGIASATLFGMQPRGIGSIRTGLPHIVVTGALSLLGLFAIGAAAVALGRRFRRYSIATILTALAAGGMTLPYATDLAAGIAAPGFGILERIDVYASLLWVAVLAVVLLRRPPHAAARYAGAAAVRGDVAPGFEEVRAEFECNFAERREIGAALAVYWRGEKVVDLWGGRRDPSGDAPWEQDTMVAVMSATQGLSAMALAVASSRGWLDYDAPVARYWPEFAHHRKGTVTVRQLLGHEAGLLLLDERLTLEELADPEWVASLLARQAPAWTPGTRHGYHTSSIGFYMQELMRRADPRHRTIGRVFRDEIAAPLGLDVHIGLPPEVPDSRVARLRTLSVARALLALRRSPPVMVPHFLSPTSPLRRSMLLADLELNDRRSLEVELPAANGVGTARAIARAYAALAEGGAELGLTPETFAQVTAPPPTGDPLDAVLGMPSWFSLGFMRPGPHVWFGSSEHALGAPGVGGSFAFADPDARLGYAYVMNRMDFHFADDPREKALRDAVYRAIVHLAAQASPGGERRADHRGAADARGVPFDPLGPQRRLSRIVLAQLDAHRAHDSRQRAARRRPRDH